jgi:transposase
MEAYSMDLRERVVRACDEGLDTQEEIAQTLGVSISFITKLLRRRRDEKTIAAKPRSGGGKPSLGKAELKRIGEWVAEQPDATLKELCERLHDGGGTRVKPVKVKPWTMCRALQRLGRARKKSPFTPRSGIRLA